MKLDVLTLAVIMSIILFTQVIALFVQYRVNRNYRELESWLIGSAMMALGFTFMPLLTIKSLELLARVANPLIILGQIFLYIGILRFLNKKESKLIPVLIYILFLVPYYYFIFVQNEISGRTVVASTAIAVISLMCSYKLFTKRDKFITSSAHFTASVFLFHGCFLILRVILTLISPAIQAYNGMDPIQVLGFVVPIFTSTLWTFGFIIMVNQRLNDENIKEKEKLQMVFNTSPDAALITRLVDGLFVDVNSGFSEMTGYKREDVIGNSTVNINLWNDIEDRRIFVIELENKGFCKNMEFVFQRKDGSQFFGLISSRIIMINSKLHIVSVIHDVTDQKKVEETIRESEETYRSILNASPDDITITDLEGRILMISPAAKKMFGYEPEYERFIGSMLVDYILPEDAEKAKANIVRMYQGNFPRPNEYRGVRRDKSIFDIEVNSGFIHNAAGQPIKMVFIVRDVTERKQAENQIQELFKQLEIEKNIAQLNSITDSLTGLSNRRYLDEALRTEFFRLKRAGSQLSLIMLDVDHFKKFNDSYGHLAGDDCLRQIGAALKATVNRVPDIVARYGGEEFLVILPETDGKGAAALAEQIRKAVEEIKILNKASDIAEYVTVSLGVVTAYTTGLSSPEQLVALADEAMYRAKQGGRNRIEVSTS